MELFCNKYFCHALSKLIVSFVRRPSRSWRASYKVRIEDRYKDIEQNEMSLLFQGSISGEILGVNSLVLLLLIDGSYINVVSHGGTDWYFYILRPDTKKIWKLISAYFSMVIYSLNGAGSGKYGKAFISYLLFSVYALV